MNSFSARVKRDGSDYDPNTIVYDNDISVYYDEYDRIGIKKSYPVHYMTDKNKIDREDVRYGTMYIKIENCSYDTVSKEVEFIGYPECNGHKNILSTVSLTWYASKLLTIEDAELVHSLARIGEYNNFVPSIFWKALIKFGFDGKILLGREESVAIYLVTENGEKFIESLYHIPSNYVGTLCPDEYSNGKPYRRRFIAPILERELKEEINWKNVWRLWWD